MKFPSGWLPGRCHVSFREGNCNGQKKTSESSVKNGILFFQVLPQFLLAALLGILVVDGDGFDNFGFGWC